MRTKLNLYRLPFFLTLLGLASIVGCGAAADPLGRQDISGEVTLKNEPLDGASIIFEPEDPSIPTSGGASVKQGKFELPKGRGLAPGEYRVRVSAAGGDVFVTEDVPGDPIPSTERVPTSWNSESQQTITVEQGGKNHFEFNIP